MGKTVTQKKEKLSSEAFRHLMNSLDNALFNDNDFVYELFFQKIGKISVTQQKQAFRSLFMNILNRPRIIEDKLQRSTTKELFDDPRTFYLVTPDTHVNVLMKKIIKYLKKFEEEGNFLPQKVITFKKVPKLLFSLEPDTLKYLLDRKLFKLNPECSLNTQSSIQGYIGSRIIYGFIMYFNARLAYSSPSSFNNIVQSKIISEHDVQILRNKFNLTSSTYFDYYHVTENYMDRFLQNSIHLLEAFPENIYLRFGLISLISQETIKIKLEMKKHVGAYYARVYNIYSPYFQIVMQEYEDDCADMVMSFDEFQKKTEKNIERIGYIVKQMANEITHSS